MDTHLLALLTRIETALTTLTDSIATYNPSIPAAQALLTADADLQNGLKDLHTHQRNHARIQQLRETIDQQNAQITSTVQLLADTRADLLAVPTALPQKERRDVQYTELLDYAKRISRFTAPPNFRAQIVPKATETERPDGADVVMGENTAGDKEGIGLEQLKQEEKQWLDPWTGIQFTPWPSEEVMKRGALFRLQGMLERKEDIEGVKEENEIQGDEPQRQTEAQESKPRVSGIVPGPRKKEDKPKVFGGLDLYDPDDEDE